MEQVNCSLNMSAWQLVSFKSLNNAVLIMKCAGYHTGFIERDDLKCCLGPLFMTALWIMQWPQTSKMEPLGIFKCGNALNFIMAVSFHSCHASLLKDTELHIWEKHQHMSVIYLRGKKKRLQAWILLPRTSFWRAHFPRSFRLRFIQDFLFEIFKQGLNKKVEH